MSCLKPWGRFERAFSRNLPLVKVNPLQARRLAQACGTRVKTDTVDARMLASFGNDLAVKPDQPIDDKQYKLKELFSSRGGLIKDRTHLINRFQTQTLALVKRKRKARIDQITRQLKHCSRTSTQECKTVQTAPELTPYCALFRVLVKWLWQSVTLSCRRSERFIKRELQASQDLFP